MAGRGDAPQPSSSRPVSSRVSSPSPAPEAGRVAAGSSVAASPAAAQGPSIAASTLRRRRTDAARMPSARTSRTSTEDMSNGRLSTSHAGGVSAFDASFLGSAVLSPGTSARATMRPSIASTPFWYTSSILGTVPPATAASLAAAAVDASTLPTSTPARRVPAAPADCAAPGSQNHTRTPSPSPRFFSAGTPSEASGIFSAAASVEALMGSTRTVPPCHAPPLSATRLVCSAIVAATSLSAASRPTRCKPARPSAPCSTSSGGAGGGGDMPAIRAVARSPSTRSSSLVSVNALGSAAASSSMSRAPASISTFFTSQPPSGGGGASAAGSGGASPGFSGGGGGSGGGPPSASVARYSPGTPTTACPSSTLQIFTPSGREPLSFSSRSFERISRSTRACRSSRSERSRSVSGSSALGAGFGATSAMARGSAEYSPLHSTSSAPGRSNRGALAHAMCWCSPNSRSAASANARSCCSSCPSMSPHRMEMRARRWTGAHSASTASRVSLCRNVCRYRASSRLRSTSARPGALDASFTRSSCAEDTTRSTSSPRRTVGVCLGRPSILRA